MLPVIQEDSEEVYLQFIFSNNPTIIFPCPGTETVYITLRKAEDEDEDEYDEDDDEYDDEDDDEDEYDEDDDEDEEDEDDEDDYKVTRSYAPPRPSYSGYSRPAPPPPPPKPKPLNVFERAELNSARNVYDAAVHRSAMTKGSSSYRYHEAAEKRAFANLMRIEAKYAGRK